MKGLNLSSFKKVKEDQHSATMRHESGHTLVIAKGALPAIQKKQLEKLPMYAEGGTIDPIPPPPPPTDKKTVGSIIGYPGYANGGNVRGNPESTPDQPMGTDTPPPIQTVSDQVGVPATSPNAAPAGGGASASWGDAPTAADEQGQSSQAPAGAVPQAQNPTPEQAKMNGYEQEQKAVQALGQAKADQAAAEAKAYQAAADAQAQLPTQQKIIAGYQQADKAFADSLSDPKNQIDPNRYWHSLSAPQQIAHGIGIVLSGIGSGLTKQPNMALEVMNNAINKDIMAQQNAQDTKMNLWKMNRAALGNDLAANLATRNQMWLVAQNNLQKAAAQATGPIAKQEAAIQSAKIQQEIDLNHMKLGLLGSNSPQDFKSPADKLGAMTRFGMIPPEQAGKIADAIDAGTNTIAGAPGLMDAFDRASEEARPLTGGTNTSVRAFIPGMQTPAQEDFKARLIPMFKDVEPTARQAAIDSFYDSVKPKFGEGDQSVANSRAAVQDFIKSKSSSALAKSYGIDLSKYPATNLNGVNVAPQGFPAHSKSGRPIEYRDGKAFYK